MLSNYKIESKNIQTDKEEFVSAIVINKKGQIFRFIRKDNQKLDPGKTDMISGHIKNNGETPTQAMYREIIEETGINHEEIQIHNLGNMTLPHPLIKDKQCCIFLAIIDYTQEQLNESIKEKAKEKEIEKAETLENFEALKQDIKNAKSNWRIFYTEELGQKIDLAQEIFINIEKQRQIEL